MTHRVYSHLMDPRVNPDYGRHAVKPPNWDTFGDRTQFVTLRGFTVKNKKLVDFSQELDKYTKTFDLGTVIWPSYDCIFASNLGDLADAIKKRGLFLFDIWGYVPGSGPGGYWMQFTPPHGVFKLLESKLGDHWLGMDVGEQDGRYIGGYASQMYPISADRFEQYLNFHRHFERMCDDLGNRMSALVSLNFGHYLLKDGVYCTIGAETAQALPNSQVYYAFIRGAGKQYGVPWFGNASVWNRWGWKTYGGTPSKDTDPEPRHGPTWGTSLNLLKRLMYNQILYNCVFVGFESSWFQGNQLSPVGKIQQAAQKWVRKNGEPGVMMTPVALLLDFDAGWTFPRHLYSGNVYRVWGNVPYGEGDYWTNDVIGMLYPGYQDSSYYHDERGFLAPTPYGDIADCLLSDAPLWVLKQYSLIVAADALHGGAEVSDKLTAYVKSGGRLMITAGNISELGGFAGVKVGASQRIAAGQAIQVGSASVTEDRAFDAYALTGAKGKVLASVNGTPLAERLSLGKGSVTVLATRFGVGVADPHVKITGGVDQPLVNPYPMLNHVRAILGAELQRQALFGAGEGLSVTTCRKGPGEYTLCICNNALAPRPFKIVSYCGPIESVKELPLDQSEKGAPGYLPHGSESAKIGVSTATTIAGGDVRVFSVKVHEENVKELPAPTPPKRPVGRGLPLRGARSIEDAILARPTFFQHFDSVSVDWRYVHDRDIETLRRESGWLKRQGVRIYVDLTSGLNLYPDLRLLNNVASDYQATLKTVDDVLEKMNALGSKELIVSLHREPENNFTHAQSQAGFEAGLRAIAKRAEARHINVLLRTSPKGGSHLGAVTALLDKVGAPNLSLAVSTALLIDQKVDPASVEKQTQGKIGLWLASAPEYDAAGKLWTANGDVAGHEAVRKFLAVAPQTPVLLDGVYSNWDEEYRDIVELTSIR